MLFRYAVSFERGGVRHVNEKHQAVPVLVAAMADMQNLRPNRIIVDTVFIAREKLLKSSC